MPVTGFEEGDLFTIRSFKRHQSNPDRVWANNYEVRAKIAGDEGDLGVLLEDTREFEQTMSLNVIEIIRLTASTWSPDSVPYDPTAFMSIPVSFVGLVSPGINQPVALNQCVDVNRIPLSGRFGHLFYRGWLTEALVSAPAGTPILTNADAMNVSIASALDDTGFGAYFDGTNTTFEMVMINHDSTQIRRVVGLLAQKISTVPMNHTWFNRSSITVP